MAIVRLRGRVRGASSGAIVLRRAELVTDGGERVRSDEGDAIDVVLDDGSSVRVQLGEQTAVLPARVRTGKWGDLESDEAATAFRKRAPAPHVEVKRLASTLVKDGDAIELVGEPLEEIETSDASGYRSASGKRIVAVRASHVAVGSDAGREIDRALARGKGFFLDIVTLVFGGIFLGAAWLLEKTVEQFQWVVTVVLVAAAIVAPLFPPMVAIYVESATLGGLGLVAYLAHKRREPPHFTTGNEHAASYFFWWGIFMPPVYALLPAIVFLWLVIEPIINAVSSRRTARRMRVLVGTPPFSADRPDGAWGSAWGTIEKGTTDFTLRTADGPIEVLAGGAPWSTTPSGGDRIAVGPGKSVLLVGRIERGDGGVVRVRYTGPDALMYFVTPSDLDPAAEVRRYLSRRARTYAFMISLSMVVLVVSLWLLTKIPLK